MIVLGPLVLLVMIAVVVYLVTRSPGSTAPRSPAPTVARRYVDALLTRWTAAGLLSGEQAAALAEYEAAAEPVLAVEAPRPDDAVGPPRAVARAARRIPAAAEALGYLGGLLAVIGLVLIVERYWPDMATAARLALSGAGAVALFVAGVLVRPDDDAALERLRGFVWVTSSACAALFAGVVGADVFDAESPKTIVAAASAAVLIESVLLWLWYRRALPFQQLTLFGAMVVLGGSLVSLVAGAGAVGTAVWVAGAVLVVVGIRRLAPVPAIGEMVGGISMAVGAFMTVEAWDQRAFLFAALTGSALLALALVPGLAPEHGDHVRLGVIGLLTSLQAVPATIGYFAQDAGLVTGLATWVGAAALLYVGIRELTRGPMAVEAVGAVGMLVGAAVTGAQAEGFAPIFGVVTAVALVATGMLPGQSLLSLFGSAGLLINVLWSINHFFPGEGRAPLLIMVAGALILAIAVLLTRSGKLRRDLRAVRRPRSGPRSRPPTAAPGPA